MPTKIQKNILSYQDYRLYLNDFVLTKKQTDQYWSIGSWAKTLGLKSTSSITKILNNHRLPGPKITQSLIKYFNFNPKESSYFQNLIEFEKAKNNPSLKSTLLQELIENNHSKNQTQFLDLKTFEVISQWYHLAIREMSRLKKFKATNEWISKNFIYPISESKVKLAINNLLKINLLLQKGKKLKPSDGNLSTSEDIHSLAIQHYHESMLDIAKHSIKAVPLTEREYLSGTLSFKKDNLEKAKIMLRKFLDDFGQTMDIEQGDEIYQIQLQFFPITKSTQKRETK